MQTNDFPTISLTEYTDEVIARDRDHTSELSQQADTWMTCLDQQKEQFDDRIDELLIETAEQEQTIMQLESKLEDMHDDMQYLDDEMHLAGEEITEIVNEANDFLSDFDVIGLMETDKATAWADRAYEFMRKLCMTYPIVHYVGSTEELAAYEDAHYDEIADWKASDYDDGWNEQYLENDPVELAYADVDYGDDYGDIDYTTHVDGYGG